MSGDPRDETPITPSLLMGGRLLHSTTAPSAHVRSTAAAKDVREQWRQRLSLTQQAWNRFRKDYMTRALIPLAKWREEKPSLQKGDVVLVSTESTTRGTWPLAVVEEAELSNSNRSGLVRTVRVRLASGKQLRRPIQHLVHLECRE